MEVPKTVVIATGGFDPIHAGHLSYLESAKRLGDWLVVGVNSDEWLSRKKGQPFMSLSDRSRIVDSLKWVDYTIAFDDTDGSAIDAIKRVRRMFPNSQLIFANGGDRTSENIPEMKFTDSNLRFEFSVGGNDKQNSSSLILSNWQPSPVYRVWGYYRVLNDDTTTGTKVKELVVNPKQSLSMQRHSMRGEFWFVQEGTATVYTTNTLTYNVYNKHETINISVNEWHQLRNETDSLLKIIEIQYGTSCTEDDIERK